MIEAANLSKRFGPTIAVEGVSFEIQRGEVVGFLGPNGAGKTTTMRMLTCYLPPDAGTAKVAGYDVTRESLEVRRRIGYLPESAPLYSEMGVLDYLNFIAEVRGIDGTRRRQRIRDMIGMCGLERVVRKDIGELSKGYRQRVGLAQTLIHDPDVLVLDEPTSGLDPTQIKEIRELIKQIGREKTVILSTHILPEVEATCSRLIIIHNGRLVADDTLEKLTERARGGDRIYATFRGPAAEIEPALARVPGVRALRALAQPVAERVRFEITAAHDAEVGERIFALAAENRWPLSELSAESSDLEGIFIKLTESDAGAGAGKTSSHAAGAL